jgi:hypothetical protein
MIKDLLPIPVKIESAGICRDGGSLWICFVDSDKIFYELFIKIRLDVITFKRLGYKEPILEVYDSDNFGKIKKTKILCWEQGNELVENLMLLYNQDDFHEKYHAQRLFELVKHREHISEALLEHSRRQSEEN